jgi:hypothetical protein
MTENKAIIFDPQLWLDRIGQTGIWKPRAISDDGTHVLAESEWGQKVEFDKAIWLSLLLAP